MDNNISYNKTFQKCQLDPESKYLQVNNNEYNGSVDQAIFYIKLFRQFKYGKYYPMKHEYESKFVSEITKFLDNIDNTSYEFVNAVNIIHNITSYIIEYNLLSPILEINLWSRIAFCFKSYVFIPKNFTDVFSFDDIDIFVDDLPKYQFVADDIDNYEYVEFELSDEEIYDYSLDWDDRTIPQLYPIINRSGYYGFNTSVLSYLHFIQPIGINTYRNSNPAHFIQHDYLHATDISKKQLGMCQIYLEAIENQTNIDLLKLLILVMFFVFHERSDLLHYGCLNEAEESLRKIKFLQNYHLEMDIINTYIIDYYNDQDLYIEYNHNEPKYYDCIYYSLAFWIIGNVYPSMRLYVEKFIPELFDNPELKFERKF